MVTLKSAAEIEILREAGKRLAGILAVLKEEVRAGITTNSLDEASFKLIKKAGAKSAFLGYRPAGSREAYPKTICVSVNGCVVHGLPSDYVLREGDVVKLDLGLKYKEFYVDSAITVGVGKIGAGEQKLIRVTEEALRRAIKEAYSGRTLGDIGGAVEEYVRKNKFSVVKLLTGHGIGRGLHEEPAVLNFGRPGEGQILQPGMVLAIEPMVAAGSGEIEQRSDDSFHTVDGSMAAHFEHTVAILKEGPEILTVP